MRKRLFTTTGVLALLTLNLLAVWAKLKGVPAALMSVSLNPSAVSAVYTHGIGRCWLSLLECRRIESCEGRARLRFQCGGASSGVVWSSCF